MGQSITLREDDEWLIVVPLDKDASCFHGKNSDWCTTKYHQPQFEEYFYDNEVVLVYCLNKTSGGMWALAGHKRAKGKLEIFDQRDNSITAEELKSQTGLDAAELIELALAQSEPIDKSRSDYVDARAVVELKLQGLRGGKRDEELEQMIVQHKFGWFATKYVRRVPNSPEDVQRLAVRKNGYSIEHIENPSEEIQLLAVQEDYVAFRFIKNPTPAVTALYDKLRQVSQ